MQSAFRFGSSRRRLSRPCRKENQMTARTMNKQAGARRRGGVSPLSPGAKTEAAIPDDELLICMIVSAFLCAPDPAFTVADLTKTVIQLVEEKGFRRRSVVIGLQRLLNAYFAPG
jgi:hypothetical protein